MASAIQDLIAKKNYSKAIDTLAQELRKRPKDIRLRMQQADVLILANRNREAIPVLLSLADEHAQDGYTAKAIAFLKRIEKLEPGRQDVEDRLSHLVQEKGKSVPGPIRSDAPAFGLEEFDPSQEISLGGGSTSVPAPEPLAMPEESSGITSALDMEGLDSIELEPEIVPTSASQTAKSFLQTPLFEGFDQQELQAIIKGLSFVGCAPGDVLVGEGAPGDSMFVIVSGKAKAYVRDRKGNYMKIKELGEGDFFGEVSVLTGKPRTATITAATEVELLELDKVTLDGITQRYPRVREVLQEFQKKRAQEAVEAIIRGKD
jgi:cyclic nucleotide-binding protein